MKKADDNNLYCIFFVKNSSKTSVRVKYPLNRG